MTSGELRDILDCDLLHPFAYVPTAGDAYDMRDPGTATVMPSRQVLAVPDSDRGMNEP
jgi:hypothetical protein